MTKNDLRIGLVLLVLITFAGTVSAGYINWISDLEGMNTYVNESGYLRSDRVYTWGINISGTNVSSVSINGVALTNLTDLSSGTADWSVTLLPSQVADFKDDCTYKTFTITIVNTNVSGSDFTNTTSQADVTVLPCIESSTAASAVSTITDVNTTSVVLTDSSASTTVMWMPGLAYTPVNASCAYGCTNVATCTIADFLLTGNATHSAEACIVSLARSAIDKGAVVVDFDRSIDPLAPSSIPALVGITLAAGIIVAVAVTRVKRRGGVKEP